MPRGAGDKEPVRGRHQPRYLGQGAVLQVVSHCPTLCISSILVASNSSFCLILHKTCASVHCKSAGKLVGVVNSPLTITALCLGLCPESHYKAEKPNSRILRAFYTESAKSPTPRRSAHTPHPPNTARGTCPGNPSSANPRTGPILPRTAPEPTPRHPGSADSFYNN